MTTQGLRWGGLAEFGSVRSQIVDQAEGQLFFRLWSRPSMARPRTAT